MEFAVQGLGLLRVFGYVRRDGQGVCVCCLSSGNKPEEPSHRMESSFSPTAALPQEVVSGSSSSVCTISIGIGICIVLILVIATVLFVVLPTFIIIIITIITNVFIIITIAIAISVVVIHMGRCQNYGPFLGP